ncbi:MAG TPA: hypothetical protein VND98_07505 [Solirubrobacterales bacterium]|nr:hypothetical protein [Solirubrobacterales bacterium]
MVLATLVALPSALEAWPAVVGAGLIPVVGMVAVGYLIIHAVRDHDEEEDDEPAPPPPAT